MFIYKLPNTQRNVLYDASKAKISGFSEKTQIINVEIMIQASGDKNVCLLYMKWYLKEIENWFQSFNYIENDLKIGRYSMQLTIMVLIKTIRVNIDIWQ